MSHARRNDLDMQLRYESRWHADRMLRRRANLRHLASDVVVWMVALVMAAIVRFELDVTAVNYLPLLLTSAIVVLIHCFVAWVTGLYAGKYVYATFDEVRSLAYAMALVGTVSSALIFALGSYAAVPRSIGFIAFPIAFLGMCGLRYIERTAVGRKMMPGMDARPTIVYGAGYLGKTIVSRMLSDSESTFRPVAFVDDDKSKSSLQIRGVNVRGGFNDLAKIAESTGASDLVIAIGYADATLVRQISDAASDCGLHPMVLPPLEEVLAGKTKLSDLRDISIEDLIGRQPVDTEVASIAGYLAGKRVLVTGAGGSIGSELSRQIMKYAPSELIMLDRDETGLQGAQLGVSGHGLLHTRDVVLADIRDVEALDRIFQERKPEVVFHAAALKHLPMLEQYPDEAWKTNVIGTLNVLRAAQSAGIETFVNVSTDKAANPTSVLGYSKRTAEKLTAWFASETGKPYISVRFGNVIGSRGSMLPTFQTLIEAGGPLTVTHPDITRYFMTIPEACQLVVQAGGIGRLGEVLILDMGEPVKILDVAQRMIEMSGKDIEIIFTGLREGEKMHEELIGEDETDSRPMHPQISHATVEPMSPTSLDILRWKDLMSTANESLQLRGSNDPESKLKSEQGGIAI